MSVLCALLCRRMYLLVFEMTRTILTPSVLPAPHALCATHRVYSLCADTHGSSHWKVREQRCACACACACVCVCVCGDLYVSGVGAWARVRVHIRLYIHI